MAYATSLKRFVRKQGVPSVAVTRPRRGGRATPMQAPIGPRPVILVEHSPHVRFRADALFDPEMQATLNWPSRRSGPAEYRRRSFSHLAEILPGSHTGGRSRSAVLTSMRSSRDPTNEQNHAGSREPRALLKPGPPFEATFTRAPAQHLPSTEPSRRLWGRPFFGGRVPGRLIKSAHVLP